ncbi:MAG TPA: hypothetical protein GX690_00555 [Tenericutes bacterium]|nr:hypothetical protein [Mycoplasmatota bacterium]
MKKYIKILSLLVISILLISCENKLKAKLVFEKVLKAEVEGIYAQELFTYEYRNNNALKGILKTTRYIDENLKSEDKEKLEKFLDEFYVVMKNEVNRKSKGISYKVERGENGSVITIATIEFNKIDKNTANYKLYVEYELQKIENLKSFYDELEFTLLEETINE